MLAGAERWEKLLKEDILPETNVRLIGSVSTGISAITGIATNGEADGSYVQGIIGLSEDVIDAPPPFVTLEHNAWLLNGTFEYVEDVKAMYGGNNRYVSEEMCGEYCVFERPPILTLSLKIPQGDNGITNSVTIRWDINSHEFSTDFNVAKVGLGQAEHYGGNDGYTQVAVPVTGTWNYNTIVIQINKWSMPYRRARITEIIDGLKLCFEKEQISTLKISKSGDLLSGSLPIDDLSVEVFDLEEKFDLDVGYYQNVYVLNAMKWFLYFGIYDDEAWNWLLYNQYFFNAISRPKNGLTAKFELGSVLDQITGNFPAEIQGSPTQPVTDSYIWSTWRELFAKISETSGVPINISGGFDWDDKGAAYSIQRKFRETIELKEWIQTVCNLTKTVIKNNRNSLEIDTLVDSVMNFKSTTPVGTISLFNSFEYPEIEKLSQIKTITLIGYQVSENRPNSEGKTFNDIGVLQTATNERLVYQDPTVSSSSGFPFGFALNYANWVYLFMNNAKCVTGNARVNPAYELYDLLNIETKSGAVLKGYLTSIDIEYTGSFKTKYTVLAPEELNK